MNSIHPHWQTTDEDEQIVPVTDANAQAEYAESDLPRAKRTPAALIGVALFIGIGFVFFQGTTSFTGQVTEADVKIVITQTGVEPVIAEVKPGETIEWTNKSGIPQILTSDAITMPDGKSFQTTAIFPDATYTFLIPANAPNGTFDYESQTSPIISGQIVIGASAPVAMPVQNVSSSSISSIATYIPTTAPVETPQPMEQEIPAETIPDGSIPVNPHTVGTANVSYTNTESQNTAPRTQTNIAKHTPLNQPATGMGAWTVAIMGTLAFLGVLLRSRAVIR